MTRRGWYGAVIAALIVLAAWDVGTARACHLTAKDEPACATVAVRATNEIYVAYIDSAPREVFFTRSLDGGATWSPRLNLSTNAGTSIRPAIAVDATGKIYVAWGDDTAGKYHVLLRVSGDQGATWSSTIDVTPDVPGKNRLPKLTLDTNGVLYVAWTNNRYQMVAGVPTQTRRVMVRFTSNGGQTWSAAQSVSQLNSLADVIRSDMVVGTDGRLYVVWEDDVDGNFDVYMSRGVRK